MQRARSDNAIDAAHIDPERPSFLGSEPDRSQRLTDRHQASHLRDRHGERDARSCSSGAVDLSACREISARDQLSLDLVAELAELSRAYLGKHLGDH